MLLHLVPVIFMELLCINSTTSKSINHSKNKHQQVHFCPLYLSYDVFPTQKWTHVPGESQISWLTWPAVTELGELNPALKLIFLFPVSLPLFQNHSTKGQIKEKTSSTVYGPWPQVARTAVLHLFLLAKFYSCLLEKVNMNNAQQGAGSSFPSALSILPKMPCLSFPPLLLCTANTGCSMWPALQNPAAGVTCLKPACSMNFWQFLLVNVLIRNRFQAQQHLQSTVMPLGTLPYKSISLQSPKTHSEHCTNTFHTYTQITLSHSGLEKSQLHLPFYY